VEARLANLPPCLIGMEACVGAHHLSRKLKALGHDARLMPAKYVRPYSKGEKNDYRDADAIAEAVQRPTMKFVATKSADQLDLQALHRVRERRNLLHRTAGHTVGSFTSLWLLGSTVRMSASHPRATKSLRSSEMTLSAMSRPEQVQQSNIDYSITSSARASSIGGTVRPSAMTVGRLMTSSNLVGCTTGRSAGFSPLRTRPV
jgi:hypothetical protein